MLGIDWHMSAMRWVAVLFTLLHALIQAYVLTTLTSMFYGETTEKHAPKPKKTKKVKAETVNN